MGLREVTGYIAHVLLAAYWLWLVIRTAPQLRKGTRDRGKRLRIALLRTAVLAVLFLAVGVIHFWGTELWHIAGAILVAGVLVLLLRRAYRRLVAPAAAPDHAAPAGAGSRGEDPRAPHGRQLRCGTAPAPAR